MAQKKKKEDKPINATESLSNTPTFRDIIPNRVNENHWKKWIELDDSSCIVASILDSIIEQSWVEVDKRYKSRYLIPLTVDWAMKSMFELLEWEFIAHDPGEQNSLQHSVWEEDTEPLPSEVDSWVRGRVPLRKQSTQSNLPSLDTPKTPLSSDSGSEDTQTKSECINSSEINKNIKLIEESPPLDITAHPIPPKIGKPKFKRNAQVKHKKIISLSSDASTTNKSIDISKLKSNDNLNALSTMTPKEYRHKRKIPIITGNLNISKTQTLQSFNPPLKYLDPIDKSLLENKQNVGQVMHPSPISNTFDAKALYQNI